MRHEIWPRCRRRADFSRFCDNVVGMGHCAQQKRMSLPLSESHVVLWRTDALEALQRRSLVNILPFCPRATPKPQYGAVCYSRSTRADRRLAGSHRASQLAAIPPPGLTVAHAIHDTPQRRRLEAGRAPPAAPQTSKGKSASIDSGPRQALGFRLVGHHDWRIWGFEQRAMVALRVLQGRGSPARVGCVWRRRVAFHWH